MPYDSFLKVRVAVSPHACFIGLLSMPPLGRLTKVTTIANYRFSLCCMNDSLITYSEWTRWKQTASSQRSSTQRNWTWWSTANLRRVSRRRQNNRQFRIPTTVSSQSVLYSAHGPENGPAAQWRISGIENGIEGCVLCVRQAFCFVQSNAAVV